MFNHFRNTGFPCVCVSVCPEPFLATGAHKTKHIFEKRWVNEAPFVCAGVRAQVCSLCWHARRFQCPHYFREVVRLALETEDKQHTIRFVFLETRFLELCFYEICFLSLSRQIRFAFRLFLFSFCVVLCLCFILFVVCVLFYSSAYRALPYIHQQHNPTRNLQETNRNVSRVVFHVLLQLCPEPALATLSSQFNLRRKRRCCFVPHRRWVQRARLRRPHPCRALHRELRRPVKEQNTPEIK